MQDTGIFRRVDALGRFVLPKELRRRMDINENDYIQIFTKGDTIILRKGRLHCTFCGAGEQLEEFYDKKICTKCIRELSER